MAPRLLAVSDLHVRYPENRMIVEGLRPTHDGDWLIVAGDVAERLDDVVWALELLRGRFARVFWVPGSHRAAAVVYVHLHIPRVTVEDGVRFVEASLGYPREWRAHDARTGTVVTDRLLRQVLPAPAAPAPAAAG